MLDPQKVRALIPLCIQQKGTCYYCHDCLEMECILGRTPKINFKEPSSKKQSVVGNSCCLVCEHCSKIKNNTKTEEEMKEYIYPYLEKKMNLNHEKYNLKKKYA